MRQPSGGAPVVVGGRESRPHGEGVQDDLCWDNESVLQFGGLQMNIDEVQRGESSGKPDAGKLARPVWGWGRGAIPRPTPPGWRPS